VSEVIRIEHATVRREGVPILDDVSFSVHEGERVAVIGPNGAGKSTLVQVISEEIHPLYNPLGKRILFGNDHWQVSELRKRLGIVSQALQWMCNSTDSAFDIVVSGFFSSIGLDFHHHVTEEEQQKALEAMRRTGSLELKDKQMNRLSSGEARRVLLARACVHDPSVLLLDEAAGALDFPARAHYREIIRTFAQEGRTLILVTHELSEIIPEIDRVVLMRHGRIVADGSKTEMLTAERLSDLYGTKVYVDRHDGLYNAWC
jgi:iron complex transport system ATP-binding protein